MHHVRGNAIPAGHVYCKCKEQIRMSYGCALVISNIVRHNYKLNHNALKHTKLIVI